MARPRVFWDSSALIAAIMARTPEAPGPTLLRAGEAAVIEMCLTKEVISDATWAIEKRRPDLVHHVAEILVTARFVTLPDPSAATVNQCVGLTGYRPDARILAGAVECNADLLVTYDRTHFLGNPLIGPPDANVRVVTPSEALSLLPGMLSSGT